MTRPIFAGVDVGGTAIKVGLVTEDGETLADTKFSTLESQRAEVSLVQVRQTIEDLISNVHCDYGQLASIGLATPGPMDIASGSLLTPFNLPGWWNQNVRDVLSRLTDRPVTFSNDASAAAFGEYWIGSGSQFSSLVLFTLGTGIGGGIIVDDETIDGAHSHGAEIGHITVDIAADARVCSCGNRGHVEGYASATAVVARSMDRLDAGEKSVMTSMISPDSPLNSLDIYQAADANDPLALRIISETADYLGSAISSVAHTIDPQAVLLGGAMNFGGSGSKVGACFLEQIIERVKNCSLPIIAEKLTIEFATLGANAGFVGAAGLAKRDYFKTALTTPV